MIRDVHPGSRILGSKQHRIQDPGSGLGSGLGSGSATLGTCSCLPAFSSANATRTAPATDLIFLVSLTVF